MAKASKSVATALSELTAEMAKPTMTASAMRAMHPKLGCQQRKLELIHHDSFHGYACNWCGCRFPNSKTVPVDASLFVEHHIFEEQRDKFFGAHVCRDAPKKAVPSA